jgi:hypothetical protein
MTDRTYYVRFPGNFHPLEFRAANEAEARAKARDYLSYGGRKCKRLPNGTEVWEHTAQDRSIIKRSWDMMSRDYARAGQIFDP